MAAKQRHIAVSVIATLATWTWKAAVFVMWVTINIFLVLARELQVVMHRYLFNKDE